MEYAFEHPKEGRYARLYPLFTENEAVKTIAANLGDPSMIKFGHDREAGEKFFHLFEARVPAGADVEKAFGQFMTPEAREASIAEMRSHQSVQETAKAATQSAGPDQSTLYYPHKAIRDEFKKLNEEKGKPMAYAGRLGAWVNKGERDPDFDKFQTPEARAQWVAEGKKLEASQDASKSQAAAATERVAKSASGRTFEAFNSHGFVLPSERVPAANKAAMSALGRATDEQVVAVKKLTDVALTALRRKQYGLQATAAEAKGHTTEEFNKMTFEEREAASGVNLSAEDKARMFGLVRGSKALTAEMNSRGLQLTVEQARGKKEEQHKETAAGRGREQAPDRDQEPVSEPQGRAGNRMAQAAAMLHNNARGGR